MSTINKLITAMLTAMATTACHQEPLGPYTVEKQWAGPVVSIKDCQTGLHGRFNCLVLIEGQSRYIRREFKDWPGRSINIGDNLGTVYLVGEKKVELWRINSRYNTMSYMYSCDKIEVSCKWPSKYAPKAFTP